MVRRGGSGAAHECGNVDSFRRAKFADPGVTATGARRASVGLRGLATLWINTGTLCNLACAGLLHRVEPP